jgi:hypothetical protein
MTALVGMKICPEFKGKNLSEKLYGRNQFLSNRSPVGHPHRRTPVRQGGRGLRCRALPAAEHQRLVLGQHAQDDAAHQLRVQQRRGQTFVLQYWTTNKL